MATALQLTQTASVEFGAMEHLPALCPRGFRYCILTDHTVRGLYGDRLIDCLRDSGLDAELYCFPAGEQHKTRKTKEAIEDFLLGQGYGKDTCLLALGGGVVSDLSGFTAATYCRGIPYINIPTTLMGMVDAAIGGKTAVNTPYGKNTVGAFHFPSMVFIDVEFLATLPFEEKRAGIAEILKYGLIASQEIFSLLENSCELEWPLLIRESISIKERIILQDPLEKGLRRILNFGHTVGHALEHVSHYRISHGDAVGLGLLLESYCSMAWGGLKERDFQRICSTVDNQKFPLDFLSSISPEELIDAMAYDKKALQGMARIVMIEGIGSVESFDGIYCTPLKPEWILKAYEYFSH